MKTRFTLGEKVRKTKRRFLGILLVIMAVIALLGLGAIFAWYQISLRPKDAVTTSKQLITIRSGMGADNIADLLEDADLIRSSTAFGWYTASKGVKGSLQAGTYEFSANQTVSEMVDKLVKGEVARRTVTFVPGRRLDQLRSVMIEAKFSPEEVDRALDTAGRALLTGILPDKASLEGYLYAETYILGLDQPPEAFINLAVKEFLKHLTPEVRAGIERQGLSVHEAVILASIVQQESSQPDIQRQVAQVFLKRLDEGISLGADPTFKYAAAILGVPASTTINSPYNTRIHRGLPPGPIGSFSKSALEAVANPAEGDYLYFVAGKDNVTRFSRSLEEHEALKREHGVAGQD